MRLTLSHHCCRTRPVPDGIARVAAPAAPVSTPNGPAAADEVFEWMNRQVTWQSLLADLEVLACLAHGDAFTEAGRSVT
jgi:hypothetical protein